jgi:hypothetical protein
MAPGIKTDGRKNGSRNKRQTALKEAAEIAARAALPRWNSCCKSCAFPDQDLAFRAEMAKAAAPYVHQKLVATDNTNRNIPPNPNQTIGHLEQWQFLVSVRCAPVQSCRGKPVSSSF